MQSVGRFSIPADIYDSEQAGKIAAPRDGASRLRYIEVLAYRASRLRLEQPGFFALPYAFYSSDRERFHRLWDPLRPPITSVGVQRMVPSVADPHWFSFFYTAAIQHEMGMSAPIATVDDLACRLQLYRGTLLAPEQEALLIEHSLSATLGRGTAVAAVLDAAGIAAPRRARRVPTAHDRRGFADRANCRKN